MNFKEKLGNLKSKIDREIEKCLDQKIEEILPRDKFIAESLELVKNNILTGGKRVRPALLCWGYWGAGGKKEDEIVSAAVGIELIHAFLLIHDDVMDRDFIRHGMPTVNAFYRDFGAKKFIGKDEDHFGNSMAIIVGDMVGALGNQVIFDAKFEAEKIIVALSKLQDIVSFTVVGQAKDIYMEYVGKTTEEEILKMYEYKTAKYTLEGPLHLGGILGGADETLLKAYSSFSIPLGIAFQIQDDILGIFGDEEVVGKTIGSDISEGKQTLLVLKALENVGPDDKRKMKNLLGKEDIIKGEIEEFREIIRKSGSFDYARELAEKMINEAQQKIKEAPINNSARDFFLGLADYLAKRKY